MRGALTRNHREKHSSVRDVGELVKRLESRKRTRRSVATPGQGLRDRIYRDIRLGCQAKRIKFLVSVQGTRRRPNGPGKESGLLGYLL